MLFKSLFLALAAIHGASALRGSADEEHLQWKFSAKAEHQDLVEKGLRILPPGSVAKVEESHRKLSNQWLMLGTNDGSGFGLVGSSGNVIKFFKNYNNNSYGAVCNKKHCHGDLSAVAAGYSCGTQKRSCIDIVMSEDADLYVMCPLSGFRMVANLLTCKCAAGGLCSIALEHGAGDYYYYFDDTDSCSGTEDRPLFWATLKCDPFP